MLDPRNELASNHVEQFDLFGKRNASYESWRQGNYGARARKTAQNYENRWSRNGEEAEPRPLNKKDEYGIQSPPLRTTSPERSPVHPRHQTINYRPSSPASKAQTIARGQRELMEMVRNMPDASFELTLKDIVEHPGGESQEACLLKDRNYVDHQVVAHQRVKTKKYECQKNEKKAKMIKNGSMDNRGLFLKMVFPVPLKSKKKNNTMNNYSSTSANVSPKPEISDKTNSKSVDKDWWKKRVSVPSDQSESNRSSSNSGSSGSSSSCDCRSSSSGSGSSSSSGSGSSSIRNKSGIMNMHWLCFYCKKCNTS